MAVVFYGLAGEGRGHATRALTVVEHLAKRHRIVLFAFGVAYDMLRAARLGANVEVRPISGMHLEYGPSGKVSRVRTLARGFGFVQHLMSRSAPIRHLMYERLPQLVISDFEPLTAYAARLLDVPWLSIDHQRLLSVCDLSGLDWQLRAHAAATDWILRGVYGQPPRMVVSGFYLPGARRGFEHVCFTGTLIRAEVRNVTPRSGSHLVAYLRKGSPSRVLDALAALGRVVRVYGLGARAPVGSLRFHDTAENSFVEALADSAALISTAGNQLIGEALYLGKPVLAFPEPGNFEQRVNGWLLNRSQAGLSVDAGHLTVDLLRRFLDRGEQYVANASRASTIGNDQVFRFLDGLLESNEQKTTSPRHLRLVS